MILSITIGLTVLAIVLAVVDLLSRVFAPSIEVTKHQYNKHLDVYEDVVIKEKSKGLDGIGYLLAVGTLIIAGIFGITKVIADSEARAAESRCEQYVELGNEAVWSRTGTFSFKCLVKHNGIWLPIDQVGIVTKEK